ncbi:MAG: hypothetical protein HWN66_06505 [Candidatus Helarchaeota archaeon]|nr:hypothetical protein [Candidatus Helarchaeota archaeon]
MIPVLDSLSLIVISLWFIIVGLYLIGGILFVRQSIKYSEEPRVKILAFIGLFLMFAALSRLFHPTLFILFDQLESLSYLSNSIFIAAIIMFVFYLERDIYPPSRYIFTIILVISEIIFIIGEILLYFGIVLISREILDLIVPIALVSAGIFMAILYIKIAIQSQGEARKDAIYIILGGIFFAGSYLLSGLEGIVLAIISGLEGISLFTAIIAPVLALMALPLMVKGFRLSL